MPVGINLTLPASMHAALSSQTTWLCAQELYRMVEREERGSGALQRVIKRFLGTASWRQVAQPLLPLLPDAQLLRALTHALPDGPPGMRAPSR